MSASARSLATPGRPLWLLMPLACCLALGLLFADALAEMAATWFAREEYSHGVLIPFIAAYLAWRQRGALLSEPLVPAPSGVILIVAAVLLNLLGKLAAVFVLQQYAFVLALYGVAATVAGWRGVRALWAPLLILLFMVPLPNFLLNNLSSQLQLISSQLGVWFIRLWDVAVFVEGNVIDLGGYQLQVAEACDGLRYLFPLLTMSFIVAYLFKTAMWKRVVLFLSAIPLTILMNGLRVGMIGVMVDRWGVRMAEGFLHEFQGWAIFMVSAALLFAELILLANLGRDRAPWRTVFDVAPPPLAPAASRERNSKLPEPFMAGTVVLAVFAALLVALPARTEAVPGREPFLSFPTQFGGWSGRRAALERIYLDTLQLDDYVLADYRRAPEELVNLYVAWYDSQRAGQSAHSPRSCLPGGGWRITSLQQVQVPTADRPLRLNRVQIELGNQKQLVYYWFQQRGRIMTNEYLAKWYLFWDSLTRRRTDGALVRLATPLLPGENAQAADARLAAFLSQAAPRLARHIPD